MGKRQRARDRARSIRPIDAAPCATAETAGTAEPRRPSMSDLEELTWLAEERRRLGDREQEIIVALVAAGTPWPAISASLGVSRQAARQRFLRTHGTG